MKEQQTIFTPRDMRNKRLEMHITTKDYERFKEAELTDAGYEWVEIVNLDDNKKYLARRASCGLDCFCDAQVKPTN